MRLINLYVRTAALGSLILAACACQTAQKPASLLPPGSAPAMQSAPRVAASQPQAAVQKPADSPAQKTLEPAASISPLPDPVGDLVDRAEKQYQAGLANHLDGKNEEAKQNFDQALNALLESNVDVRSDERLAKEFDRIVQGVNELY